MLAFADQFGRHSLVLRDRVRHDRGLSQKALRLRRLATDPIYGGGLKLSELDLKQRYTHILDFALRGLDEPTRKLLCRIAVISEHATYDTLAVLNPFLRPGSEPNDPRRAGDETRKAKAKRIPPGGQSGLRPGGRVPHS